MGDTITIQNVADSLARVCAAHPSTGTDSVLHPDASLIAELYGTMIYERETATPVARIEPPILEALERWKRPY